MTMSEKSCLVSSHHVGKFHAFWRGEVVGEETERCIKEMVVSCWFGSLVVFYYWLSLLLFLQQARLH